ncbi:tetrathionate reductase subunit TtrC [[Enterobacter] lignolyticus]|uniref:Polysulphide reductase NrfD n=1 Tax=Enterobacter lignolyticus (strain SCF1) TaxID=701347 RepID=E3G620_ENTLS|nr:tetrathionate reductase subunit TtrC [[Enterobacter] lignolyticus]ADO48401.1 Polysulphide reductase NrfD [[Enterobacter] lignolyticus SCF1]
MSRIMIDEVLAQPQAITWLPWAVQYFFFIGIAACAALLAAGARWIARDHSPQLQRLCLFIALTCAITAPLALTADLHQTARFWHFYAWPTPWSWMPWGALFLPLFTLLLGIEFVGFHLNALTGRRLPLSGAVAAGASLTAIGLLLYTGREVSVVLARPLWFSYGFPLAMFVSALQALLAILAALLRQHTALARTLARSHLFTLALLAAVMTAWMAGDTLSGQSLRQWWQLSGEARTYMTTTVALWLLATGGALYASFRPIGGATALLLALSAMGLCWLLRWAFLIGGQTIPKYSALANPYHLPPGTDGLLAIVGTFGLWIALMITVHEGLSWLSGRRQHG